MSIKVCFDMTFFNLLLFLIFLLHFLEINANHEQDSKIINKSQHDKTKSNRELNEIIIDKVLTVLELDALMKEKIDDFNYVKSTSVQSDTSCNKKSISSSNNIEPIHNQIFVQFFGRNQTSVKINRQPLKVENENAGKNVLAPLEIDIGKLYWSDASYDKKLNSKELGKITVEEMKTILDEQIKLSNCPSGSFYEPRVGCIDLKNFLKTPQIKNTLDIGAVFSRPLKSVGFNNQANKEGVEIVQEILSGDDKKNILSVDESEEQKLSGDKKFKNNSTFKMLTSLNNQNFEVLGMILQVLEKYSQDYNVSETSKKLKHVLNLIDEQLKQKVSNEKQSMNLQLTNEKTIKTLADVDIKSNISSEMVQRLKDVSQINASPNSNSFGINNFTDGVQSRPIINEYGSNEFTLRSLNQSLESLRSPNFMFNSTSIKPAFKNPEADPKLTKSNGTDTTNGTIKKDPKIKEMIPLNIMLKIPKDELYNTRGTRHTPLNIDLPSLLMQDFHSVSQQHDMSFKMPDVKKLEGNLQKLLESAFNLKENFNTNKRNLQVTAEQSNEIIPQLEKIERISDEQQGLSILSDTTTEPIRKKIQQTLLVREIPSKKNSLQLNYVQNENSYTTEAMRLFPSIAKSGKHIIKEHKNIISNFLPKFVTSRRSADSQYSTSIDSADALIHPRPDIIYKSILGKTLEDSSLKEYVDTSQTSFNNYSDYSALFDDTSMALNTLDYENTSHKSSLNPSLADNKLAKSVTNEDSTNTVSSTNGTFFGALEDYGTTEDDDLEHYDHIK